MSDPITSVIQQWGSQLADAIRSRAGAPCSVTGEITPWNDFDMTEGGSWFEQRFKKAGATGWTYVSQRDRDRLSTLLQAHEIEYALTDASKAWPPMASEATATAPPEPESGMRAFTIEIGLPGGSCKFGFVLNSDALALCAGLVDKVAVPGPAGLDLVLDMELPVTISIGRTQLPLRDVLKLTTGSIVELDRLITDPVDIRVSNRIVAKAEVVVIDGNYGVRVLEIVSPSERLSLQSSTRRPQSVVPAIHSVRSLPGRTGEYS
jgi:flagellar motor switch protein FliN